MGFDKTKSLLELLMEEISKIVNTEKNIAWVFTDEKSVFYDNEAGLFLVYEDKCIPVKLDYSVLHESVESQKAIFRYDASVKRLTDSEYIKIQQKIIDDDDESIWTDGGEEGNTQYYILSAKNRKAIYVNKCSDVNILIPTTKISGYDIWHVTIEDNLL